MKSVVALARSIFSNPQFNHIKYLLCYRLSQDPIEHFFGDLRQRGAWCQNPTALYLIGSYRAILNCQLRLFGLSQSRNCAELQTEDMSTEAVTDASVDEERARLLLSSLEVEVDSPTEFRANILYYTAGWVARALSKVWRCEQCKEALLVPSGESCDLDDWTPLRLMDIKQRGGLLYPSKSVYRVVLLTDQAIRQATAKFGAKPPASTSFLCRLEHDVCAATALDSGVFSGPGEHA